MLLVELKWGPVWREERRVRIEKHAEEKKTSVQREASSESVVDDEQVRGETVGSEAEKGKS
jgi:hypothetical protein